MKKRTVALVFLALVGGLVVASLLVLRTAWAGDRICGLAAARLGAVTGLPFAFGSCRIEPLAFRVEIAGVRLGPPEAPVFAADEVLAELAPVQALGRRLQLSRVRLGRPRVAIALTGGAGAGTCPPPVLSRLEVRQLEVAGGTLLLTLPGGRQVTAEAIEIRSQPPRRTLRSLAVPARRSRAELSAGPVRVELPGRSLTAGRVQADVELELDLSQARVHDAAVEVDGVRLGLAGEVQDLCDPQLDLTARADGPIRALLALAGIASAAEGTAGIEVQVTGTPRAPMAEAAVRVRGGRVGSFVPGDADAELRLTPEALIVKRLVVKAEGGAATARGTVRLAKGLPVEAEVLAEGVDLAEVIDRLGVRGPWITAKLDGGAKVQGSLWPPQLAGTLAADVRDFKALTRSYKVAAGDPGIVAFPRGRLETVVRVDLDGLYLDGARLAVGRGEVEADAAVHFHSDRGFWVRARGLVDFGVLGRLASIPWAGRAEVEAMVAAAPYGNPHITGEARAEGFHFLQVDLGDVSTDFEYQDFLLHLRGAEGVRNATRYRGEATVDLAQLPTRIVASRFEATGRLRDLFEAVLEWLPRARNVRDVMDGEVEVTGSARGPATALDVDFDARLGAGSLFGRRFDSGRTTGRILTGKTARFDRAELRRGTGNVRLTGTWDLEPPSPWELDVAFAGVPLAALDLAGEGWGGTASGTARLEGSYDHPRVRFAANGDAVSVEGLALGTVQAGGTLIEQRLALTGGAEGIDFSAEATLTGRVPFTARAALALEDGARLLPGARPGLRLRLVGEARAEGELEELQQSRARLELATAAGALADLRLEASGPAIFTARGGRVELAPVRLRGANTELTVGGTVAPGGVLDGSATGVLDLRLVDGLVPGVRKLHGQLALDAHLGGTLEEPALVGSGRITDGGFQAKGAPITVASGAGALAFSQQRVLFDALTAAVNGGRATFRGEVELARLLPARLRVEGVLDEVPLAIPAYVPVVLSGRAEAEGTPEATTLTGRLRVVRGRYTENVELEASMLELGRRRPAPPPKPYDKADEWLRFDVQLVVDGDVRVDNDLVRGGLTGDLLLTGTLASPGLVGSLAMGEGSRVVFRGNEFILTHAVLDFTDRHKVDIALDVHGESRVREYQVLMHVFGSLFRPDVTLTSVPALPQEDVITLLSLGYTRRDAAAGAGVQGVATAAAAQALFSASGLDDQVKRFLPRGGPIRDFTFRITSAYSEESGQVEPRGELESVLWKDRVRIRLQTPLGGTRGRRAQAALRLSEHTDLQYQWDTDNPDVADGDHGLDLKLRWEWTDGR